MRVIWPSPDVMGGPLSQAQFFTTTKFADANPKIVQAFVRRKEARMT